MNQQFKILRKARHGILDKISNLSLDELQASLPGFRNDILWNVVHLYVTQQNLHYVLSNLEIKVEKKWLGLFRKGTYPPSEKMKLEEWKIIKSDFLTQVDVLENDYQKGIFQEFKAYETSFGVTLNSIEDAIIFNNVHEGIHFGYILAQIRVLASL